MAHYCDWFGDGSVYVLDVPLACCALESQQAARGRQLGELPAGAKLVVTLSGTLTYALASGVRELLASQVTSPIVVAFGACAATGGPYWDSYAVVKGAQELGIGVDHVIAGCPPPPQALTRVLEEVRGG